MSRNLDGWFFHDDERVAEKTVELRDGYVLKSIIRAKWTTLRDWMELELLVNDKHLYSAKFPTMSYAIDEADKKVFLDALRETCDITEKMKVGAYEFKWKREEGFTSRRCRCGVFFMDISSRKYSISVNLPQKFGWKTENIVLPHGEYDEGTEDSCQLFCEKFLTEYLTYGDFV